MNYKDYYKILGISKGANQKEIKKAYRKLAAKFHPDKNPNNKKAEEKFKEINEANEVIGNPEKRKKYDTLGENWQAYQDGGGNFNQYARQKRQADSTGQTFYFEGDPSTVFGDTGSSDFSSFFEAFFGGQQAQSDRFRSNNRKRQQRKYSGQDIEAELPISLIEAYNGSRRTFELDGKKMRITIKPGTKDNQRLRLKGKGQPSVNGGPAGDLYLKIKVLADSRYERQNNDLFCVEEIDLYTAILGGQIEILTLSGVVKLPIPEGSESGTKLRLKSKGMPVYGKSNEYGNLIVTLNVKFPKQLSKEQKSLFEQLKRLNLQKVA